MAKKIPVSRNKGTNKPGKQGKAAGFNEKTEDLDSQWQKSRTREPQSGSFGNADIPDADYYLQLSSARTGMYKKGKKKGTQFVRFGFIVKFGEHAGVRVGKMHDISTRPVGKNKDKTAMDLLSEDLQRLNVKTAKIKSIKDIPDVCKDLVAAGPIHRCNVNTSAPDPKRPGSTGFQNVWINDVVTEEELALLMEQYGDQVAGEANTEADDAEE
jgi:hypothetical protein